MVLLGDEAQVEAHFDQFRDSANLDAREVQSLHRTYYRLKNHFGRTRWSSKMMWAMWNLVLVPSETVLVSVQERCMACAKRTVGSGIIFEALDGAPR
jgi:hypothetical protein